MKVFDVYIKITVVWSTEKADITQHDRIHKSQDIHIIIMRLTRLWRVMPVGTGEKYYFFDKSDLRWHANCI